MTCCWCASRYWRRIHGGRKSCREQYYMWHRLPVTLWPRHIVSGGSCKAHTTATACCTHRHRLMATTAHDFSSPNLFSTNHARLLLFRLLLLLWMLLVQLKMNSKCNILFSDGIRHRKNKILGWASILGYIVALCLWRRWASPLSSANIEHWEPVLHTHLRHEHHTTSSRNKRTKRNKWQKVSCSMKQRHASRLHSTCQVIRCRVRRRAHGTEYWKLATNILWIGSCVCVWAKHVFVGRKQEDILRRGLAPHESHRQSRKET